MKNIVTITGYGSQGEGVARLEDGRVVFVRGAARGDVCELAIVSENQRSCRAEIIELIQPSEHRIEVDCPAYPICGGCDFRHVTYDEELRAKLDRVNDALKRIGGTDIRATEILSTGQIDGYRNKAVFHTALEDDKAVYGFFRSGTHEVCPFEKCLLLSEELNDKLSILWKSPPTEKAVTLREGISDNQAPTREMLDGLVFQVSAGSFFQVNNDAALLLFHKAREYASLTKSSVLVDLYCGVGALTLFVGRDAGFALGVESNPAAIDDARINAELNGLEHIEFALSDSAKWDRGSIKPDCVIVDPPRKGLSERASKKVLELSPAKLVYVSCDPATLARDIRRLEGYELQKICAIDMFPRTANVECCALLSRQNS